jgi:hypothetical protein
MKSERLERRNTPSVRPRGSWRGGADLAHEALGPRRIVNSSGTNPVLASPQGPSCKGKVRSCRSPRLSSRHMATRAIHRVEATQCRCRHG